MRHFLTYHNAQKMGYSCTKIPTPRARTGKPVRGLEGSTVWLVAGEGGSPKSYFLAAHFVVDKCESDKHLGTKLTNEVSGAGVLHGPRLRLDGSSLLEGLRRGSANFVSGFSEIRDPSVITALKALVSSS